MKTALVTGDRGFIGRHFARHLEDAGWEVLRCDLADGFDARTLFRTRGLRTDLKVDLVVHCAAVVGGRALIDGAPLALAANLELDAGLFQWALCTRPGRVLYFSSSAVYPNYMQTGTRTPAALQESAVQPDLAGQGVVGIPDQLYGWAKLTGENLAHRARGEGLKVSVVRPFSGYGSDQGDCYPFPAFIDRALRRENPFTVWGSGEQVRDFIHIDDIVGACMAMCEQGIDGPVNLGSGEPVTMADLAAMVCERAHYKPDFKFDPAKPAGVRYRLANVARMRRFYTPRVPLEQGISQALAWRRSRQ